MTTITAATLHAAVEDVRQAIIEDTAEEASLTPAETAQFAADTKFTGMVAFYDGQVFYQFTTPGGWDDSAFFAITSTGLACVENNFALNI